jgi:hypothetical protein
LTDIRPFSHYLNSGQVAIAVVNRSERPIRPEAPLREDSETTAAATPTPSTSFPSNIPLANAGAPPNVASPTSEAPATDPFGEQPLVIADALWKLLEQSWASNPAERPNMKEVERFMEKVCSDEWPLRLLSIGTFISRSD